MDSRRTAGDYTGSFVTAKDPRRSTPPPLQVGDVIDRIEGNHEKSWIGRRIASIEPEPKHGYAWFVTYEVSGAMFDRPDPLLPQRKVWVNGNADPSPWPDEAVTT